MGDGYRDTVVAFNSSDDTVIIGGATCVLTQPPPVTGANNSTLQVQVSTPGVYIFGCRVNIEIPYDGPVNQAETAYPVYVTGKRVIIL